MNARTLIALLSMVIIAIAAFIYSGSARADEVCTTAEEIVAAAPTEMVKKFGKIEDVALAQGFAIVTGVPEVIAKEVGSYLIVVLENDNGEFVVAFPLTAEGCGIALDGKNAEGWEAAAYRSFLPPQFAVFMKKAGEFVDGI